LPAVKQIIGDVEALYETKPRAYASAVSAARTETKGSVETELDTAVKDAMKL
jgi:hypothetical protein